MATQADYKQQLLNLLPSGLAWNREQDSTLAALLDGFAAELARIDTRGYDLTREVNPASTTELLDEWVTVTGIYEDCEDVGNTTAEKRGAVLAKLLSQGGASINYFKSIAAAIDVDIKITDKFGPPRAGYAVAGDSVYDDAWTYAWQVRGPETIVKYARAGYAVAGDSLATFGNELLECLIRHLKPAHTAVLFAYYTIYHTLLGSCEGMGSATAAMLAYRYMIGEATGTGTALIQQLWTPAALPGLSMWLDPADDTTVTKVGALMSAIEDKSGNGNDGVQTVSGNRPDHGTNTLNGKNLITIDGANSEFLRVLDDAGVDVVGDMELFVLASPLTGSTVEALATKGRYSIEATATLARSLVVADDYCTSTLMGSDGVVPPGPVQSILYVPSGGITGVVGDRAYSAVNDIHEWNGFKWTPLGYNASLGTVLIAGMATFGGYLYWSDSINNKIYKYNGTTSYLSTNGGAGVRPENLIVYNSELYVFCTTSNEVYKLTTVNGTSTDTWTLVGSTGTVPIGPAVYGGNLYWGCFGSNSIQRWNGSSITTYANPSDGTFNSPSSLATHGSYLFAVSANTHKIHKFDGTTWTSLLITGFAEMLSCASFNGRMYFSVGTTLVPGDVLITPGLLVYDNDGSAALSETYLTSFVDLASRPQGLFAGPDTLYIGYSTTAGSTVYRKQIGNGVAVPSTTHQIYHLIVKDGQIIFAANADYSSSSEQTQNHDGTFNTDTNLLEAVDMSSGLVTGDGTATLTVNPAAALPASKEISVEVDSTGVKDLSGNTWVGINDRQTWKFNT